MLGLDHWRVPLRVAVIVMSGLVATAGGIGWAIGAYTVKDDFNARAYSRHRVPVINAQIQDTAPGFILFAGDSHVDLYRQPSTLCGRDTVNAGLSGANTEVYANVIEQITLPHRAALAILTIGTNDLLRKRSPDPEAYAARIKRILEILEGKANHVVATAIPPVGEEVAKYFNIDSIENYSMALAGVCGQFENCHFYDPYKALRRASSFGLARPGAMVDGIHAKEYRKVYEQLPLCQILSASQ